MSYQLINLDSNIALSWPYPFTSGKVVADINSISATLQPNGEPWSIALPPGNAAPTGTCIVINNVGNNNFDIVTWGSASTIATIIPGASVQIFLTDASTTDGEWGVINCGNIKDSPIQPLAITAITAKSLNPSLLINNSAIKPPGGTINFTLSESLNNLNDLNNSGIPGFLVIKDSGPLKWDIRSLVAGSNIAIDNTDGVAANPTINLQQELTQLTSAQFTDNAGNTSVINSANIIITDIIGNTCTINSTGITTSASNNPTPYNAAAWVCFSDTGSGCTSSIVIQSSYNIATVGGVTGSNGVYVIKFANSFSNNNYAVLTSLQRQGSNLMPFQTFVQSKQNGSFVVVCTDTLGNLLAPYDGMSIVVFSN